MSEEYKITNMLVTAEDIENIDNNWQSIVDEYLKVYVREKDQVIAQYIMKKQNEEIERLNKRIDDLNIINEEHRILNGMIRKELQQKENIIKEVRDILEPLIALEGTMTTKGMSKLLEILNKVGDEISK